MHLRDHPTHTAHAVCRTQPQREKNRCLPGHPTSLTGGDCASRRRRPWTSGRPSTACGTRSPTRSTAGGRQLWGCGWCWANCTVHRAAHKGDVNLAPLSEVMGGRHTEPGGQAGEEGSAAVGGVDGGIRAGTVGTPPHSQLLTSRKDLCLEIVEIASRESAPDFPIICSV